jgi:hypothetical protein
MPDGHFHPPFPATVTPVPQIAIGFSVIPIIAGLVMLGFLILMVVRLGRWLFTWLVGPEKALAPVNAPQVSRFTRLMDTAAISLWPFRPKKVRMAFPCPACCQPLLGKVGPGEELVCPWCATTFQTPEPPPAAPPVSKKVLRKAKSFSQNKGSLPWRIFKGTSFTLGICVVVSLIMFGLFETGYAWLGLGGALVAGWLVQALHRRFWHKGTFLPKPILTTGGGNVFAGEIFRTIGVIGVPLTAGVVVWIFIGCVSGFLYLLLWQM